MLVKSEDYKGFRIELYTDDYPVNPRDGFNMGTIVIFHNRYDLGDKNHGFSNFDQLERYIKRSEKRNVVISRPIYMLDHSGIMLGVYPFSCKFDSGHVGYIYVARRKVLSEHNSKILHQHLRAKVMEDLRQEVLTYSKFLSSEAYGYIIKKSSVEIESCWSIYSLEEARSGAINAINDFELRQKEISSVENK